MYINIYHISISPYTYVDVDLSNLERHKML